ncbi:unnamed protein product [Symbiodinium pilosum]|uniref:site-specific DNA-methyltransferase (cytosine-N(4)-specific) n=1 Tax=Symbiodinium pilosum TaxID=2952 RepID=A0A812NNC3_SYMPI|nr:unnamed protein product [Symbiodinium pilosum]
MEVELHCCGSEVFEPETVDLVFTSPPYFNTELYSDEATQSHVKFPTAQTWRLGFLVPTLHNAAAALRPGGYFLLALTSRRTHRRAGLDLEAEVQAISSDFGLQQELNCALNQETTVWMEKTSFDEQPRRSGSLSHGSAGKRWLLFLEVICIVHSIRDAPALGKDVVDEKTKDKPLLEEIDQAQLKAVLVAYAEQLGFRQSLESALRGSGGICPTEGLWENKGCAPISSDLKACNCSDYRACKNATKLPGLEEELTRGSAMRLYAGSCEYSGRSEKIALVVMLGVTVSLGLWCAVQNHVHRGKQMSFSLDEEEMKADSPTEAHQNDQPANGDAQGESSSQPDAVPEGYKVRMNEFGELMKTEKPFPELVMEVMKMAPGNTQNMRPISGNIYRYWALGGQKKSWLIYCGFRFVLLIQLLVPAAICRWSYYQYDWPNTEIRFVRYEFGDLEFGVSHVVSRLLSFLFTYCISLHALSITKKACRGNFSLFLLISNLPESICVPQSAYLFLFLDGFMTCYLTMTSLLAMVLVFSFAEGPKDICFDALGLLFILRLHEVDGDLDFISTQDFDSDRVGELCHYVLSCKALRNEREMEDRVPLRWTLLWDMTELLIYWILMLVPVFQLFVVDGLVLRSTGLSVGVLGAHIAQEEARLSMLESHGH